MKSYKTVLKEVEVEIDDHKFTIRELTGARRDAMVAESMSNVKLTSDGKTDPKDPAMYIGNQSRLISKCLYNETGMLVAKNIIDGWPSKVVEELYETCTEINGISKKGVEEVKKDSGVNGETGSTSQPASVSPSR